MTRPIIARREPGTYPEPVLRLLRIVEELGVPYGLEESFKLTRGQFIGDRVLAGIDAKHLSALGFFDVARQLGMPASCRPVLDRELPEANGMLFGVEHRGSSTVFKVYLEFWDRTREAVRQSGAGLPQLLHLGLKWDTLRTGHYERASYVCHPLLSFREICHRMAEFYELTDEQTALEEALSIVRLGVRLNPSASMLYLEVKEENNPRASFDVNLYKSGMTISQASALLESAAAKLGVAQEKLLPQLRQLADCPLGHLAGGIDRHGNEFLSVYAEVRPPG